MASDALLVLDLVSGALVMGLAALCLRSFWALRAELPLLMSVGFALLGVGILTVATSAFDLTRADAYVDLVRLCAHTGAALAFAAAYLSARRPGGRRWRALGWAAAGTAVLVALVSPLAPPALQLGGREQWVVAHAVQALAYGLCFLLAGSGTVARRGAGAALVPLGFLAYMLSKYTWLLIDLTGDLRVVPFVYLWRFLTIALFYAALVPALRGEGGPHAPA